MAYRLECGGMVVDSGEREEAKGERHRGLSPLSSALRSELRRVAPLFTPALYTRASSGAVTLRCAAVPPISSATILPLATTPGRPAPGWVPAPQK